MKHFLLIYGIYLLRWQLSTPILAFVPIAYKKFLKKETLTKKDIWVAIVIGNIIGGILFFWFDNFLLHY